MIIYDVMVTVLLVAGLVFFVGGAVGILRFPDFYTRLHAAGKLDTLGSLLMMIALAVFNLHQLTVINVLTSMKIMLTVVFVFMASPTATHAIVDAGVRAGLPPWTKENQGEGL